MSTKDEYQSPALLEIGSLHELTLQAITVYKSGIGSDILSPLTQVGGQITNFSTP